MPPVIHQKSIEINGRILTLETGRVAEQADGAVAVRYGETVVLSTVVGAKEPAEGLDFFPLTVDYEEKMYAAGKIPGGFFRREGRPSEAAILAARLTDRPIRPLFPKGYRNEVQVISTVLSADQENEPDILSIIGASAALTISDIPWYGPVGAVRVGEIDGELVINPTSRQLLESRLDLVVAGTADAVVMVEGQADEIPEERLVEAILLAHREIQRIVELQRELQAVAGKPKREFVPPAENTELKDRIKAYLGDRLAAAVFNPDKTARLEATAALRQETIAHFVPAELVPSPEQPAPTAKEVGELFDSLVKSLVRETILERGERPDGRRPDEIREIWIQVGVLPRPHGSALFTRGQTQVLTVCTLGTKEEEQLLDTLGIEESKRYMHHYNFPPFSVGEVRRLRGPSRRDIGHGALAERALLAVIPSEEEFPYTMRLVSEVLSSNGSTSMASVCGSTLALMDAGVPIRKPVAGVAMGLITDLETGRFTILSDIQGIEDALGDMDFKVAGTRDGVTAVQMDIKVMGITPEILRAALEQARHGRLFILDKMIEVLPAPRPEMSPYAPRVIRIKIRPEQIGEVIGPGGRIIRGIQESTGSKIEIEEDGTVFISAAEEDSARRAVREIEKLTRVPEVGEIFYGRVVTIIPSGAFVEILPGKDGFLHISEIAPGRVRSVEDVLKVGQEINVMVTGIRPDGKINLSRKALLEREAAEQEREATGVPSGPGAHPPRPHGGDREPRGPDRRGGPPSGRPGARDRGPDRRPRPGGPPRPGRPGGYRIGDRLKDLLDDES
ncbi:polyribonucleotide nucleotidyltransferase [Thermomicrobiaceae bacterium CFH 74404]|uniref:Polyribonucleotide nucleotidyltransferase n=1 Tax=Thermalbibacter longus TaxID=2951981 RepID=A0AA41WA12_9BACT|nr:polyribonucleotide nucleotidyltransferase [Thermalbibacter longus]MCM8748227.1 polyribonucleotide nucleotidyltransferase [Thermalbibacter longus]